MDYAIIKFMGLCLVLSSIILLIINILENLLWNKEEIKEIKENEKDNEIIDEAIMDLTFTKEETERLRVIRELVIIRSYDKERKIKALINIRELLEKGEF